MPLDNNLVGFDQVLPESPLKKALFASGLGPAPWLFNLIYDTRFYKIFSVLGDQWRHEPHQLEASLRPAYSFARAEEFIARSTAPFFLWVHLYPPHSPYLASPKFMYTLLAEKVFDTKDSYARRTMRYSPKEQPEIDKLLLRQEEVIRDADHDFGKFLAFLKKVNVENNSISSFPPTTANCSTRLLESCGPYLYEPIIHVPLVIHLPKQTRATRLGGGQQCRYRLPLSWNCWGSDHRRGWMDND